MPSKPPTDLKSIFYQARELLQQAHIESAHRDAECLLCHCLNVDRVFLLSHPEYILPETQISHFFDLIQQRGQGMPVAYLTGQKEFWGLKLKVTHDTLIPRPDTETLVEQALKYATRPTGRLLDLGTGSGAIALAFASERPRWQIVASDQSEGALTAAQGNAQTHQLTNISFYKSNWFEQLPLQHFDIIVSNPPYIREDDPHLTTDIRFEPRSALVASNQGLADIEHILQHAPLYLKNEGYVLLEHGFDQAASVYDLFIKHEYKDVQQIKDLGDVTRCTLGKLTIDEKSS